VDDQLSDLKSALANVTDPTDGGGYTTDGATQTCPDSSDDWDTSPFTGSALPAMPTGAEKYMEDGAGTGPGLTGDGSQDASGGSSSTASSGAGAVSTTYGSGASATGSSGSSTSSGAAASAVHLTGTDMAPLACVGIMFVSMLAGAALL
jgi:cobalamin biosynthesis Mg chelatase CobN